MAAMGEGTVRRKLMVCPACHETIDSFLTLALEPASAAEEFSVEVETKLTKFEVNHKCRDPKEPLIR